MNTEPQKCVIVIDGALSLGEIANVSAILGLTMGMKNPAVIGNDVTDSGGSIHAGIIKFPVPILKGDRELLKKIKTKLLDPCCSELSAADFTELAQGCKTYDEYINKMAQASEEDLNYIGIALCGSRKMINKLTGNLPLLK